MTTPADYPYPYGNGLGYTPVERKQALHTRTLFVPVVMLAFIVLVVGGIYLLSLLPDSAAVQPSEVTSISELMDTSNDLGALPLEDVQPN